MSILTKVPYILTLMQTLSSEDKEDLADALNTPVEDFVEVGFLKEDKKISELEDVVTCASLHVKYNLPRKLGYLIKKAGKTHFLCFSETPGKNQLIIYEVKNISLVRIEEYLDAEELRNILTDEGQSGGQATPWELAIKEYLVQNGNTTEIGGNLEVDGDYKFDASAIYIYNRTTRTAIDNKWVVSKDDPNAGGDFTGTSIQLYDDTYIYLSYYDDGNETEYMMFNLGSGIIYIKDTSKLQDYNGNLILKDIEDAVNGENTVEITITEDDWDESEEMYIKRVELNNCFIRFNFQGTHDFNFKLYCPFFKGLTTGFDGNVISTFAGLAYEPNERFIIFENGPGGSGLSCFNGVVSQVFYDL